MTVSPPPEGNRWVQAWPDGLAFTAGLGVAWFADWETNDLVWSLWLSSLVVGYSMIVWTLFRPAILIGSKAWSKKSEILAKTSAQAAVVGGGGLLVGGLFLLAFFTVHFGMFHFVHSVFLNGFFPVFPGRGRTLEGLPMYLEVLQRYWWFLPMAFMAERQAFRLESSAPVGPPDTSVTVGAIAARKARKAKKHAQGSAMMAPYKNVFRMHMLIFFFAGAHYVKLDNFAVYAVVYAAYFFPWRLLGKQASLGN